MPTWELEPWAGALEMIFFISIDSYVLYIYVLSAGGEISATSTTSVEVGAFPSI